MSAKWRALQHRHRYTYSAVVFPPLFIQTLTQTPYESTFFIELKHLVSLNSTYAQLEHVKNLAAAFSNLLGDRNSEEDAVSCAAKLYLEILFLENSLPLHRTLASVLAKCKNFRGLIEDCFRQLCEEYGGGKNVSNGKRFCVSRAALSIMSTPKLGYLVQVVEQCAILVGLDVVSELQSIVQETNEFSRPSPIVMEQCQEALSCMYYLLQRFPEKFNSSSGCEYHGLSLDNQCVLEMALMNVFNILKSNAFSRDCFVAAGVSFCAALQVCLSSDELGLFIMQGIFHQFDIQDGMINLYTLIGKIPFKGDLFDEINNFSALSRLCLIRGILTAVPRTVLATHYHVLNNGLTGFMESGNHGYTVKTILYDAILPELCSYSENPRDSHSNFHALTVMQICLQQIKTLLLGDTSGNVDNYDPIPEEMGARILKTVWKNLEDPLSQTVKQVHLIFDLYLDIQSSLHWTEGSENIKLFLRKIASDLLNLGPRCKGRYVPLASLTRRLGATTILDMNPDLLFETSKAYIDDDVCCATTTFLKCFLECLRDEYWASDGVDGGYTEYRGHCLPPILYGLAFGLTKLRSNLNTYALPILLELDVDSIFSMLAFIGIERDEGPLFAYTEIRNIDMTLGLEQQIVVLISLLKVSRTLALMEGDIDWYASPLVFLEDADLDLENSDLHCVVTLKGIEIKIPVKWLILALTHIDESLRMDAAETLFLNPKTASLPSSLELSLMRRAIPLNMRCSSTAFQMKWNSLFRKFFSRVRTALERQLKLGTWRPLVSGDANGVSLLAGAEKTVTNRAEDLFNFMKWLSRFLFFSCYPSAPYERKIMAMELILIMLNVWSLTQTLRENQDAFFSENNLCPYHKGFTSPDSTLLLVGSIIDSWDRLRESSFRILLHYPTPLPGICSSDSVREAIIWAKKLICSPRVRETDAGALTLRLLFRKYVLELSWILLPSCNIVALVSELPNGFHQNGTSTSPVVSYIASLIDWLLAAVENAEKSLSEACKNSFVHGILLTLRYTFEELDWNSAAILHSIAEMKQVLERLLELVRRITSLALWVVSADAWYLPDDMEEMVDGEAFPLEIPDDIDSSVTEKVEVKGSEVVEEIRPSEQIVMVGCWLAMKEVSLLLGTVIRKVPLPTSAEMRRAISSTAEESILPSDAMLDIQQLETIGNHFLEVLLKMKHNGAIDKTRAGFTALCNRLLCSDDPRLCQLTESWMDRLMERTVAKGQTVDDLLRRSAGIPHAFIAFFLSEPEGTPKRLLPRALTWLIGVVTKSLTDQPIGNSSNSGLCSGSSQATVCNQHPDMSGNKEISKFRDEGVVSSVHAFNVLRAAFNDTNLATDTSGFCAEALIISIRSFSSPYWEVRNSACLAYTALVRRMIGFLNLQKRESVRRALTGVEFFHRYPTLHSFLLNELKVATELLPEGSSDELGSNLKNAVHPSLCPILILLSRLKPSPIASEIGDTLEPFLFMPFIRKCSFQSNFRIRVLASRALTGLIANEKLQVVMLNIASELPCERSWIMTPDSSSTSNSTNGSSCSFNSIHGMLLQLNSIVDINCRSLSDSSKKDTILHELIQVLATHSWIGRSRQCPCPILNGCMLKVLDNMLSIARTCGASRSATVIWNLLWELSSDCLDLEPAGCSSYFDPTIQEIRKQAATSYFNCFCETSKEVVEDELPMRGYLSSPATISSRVVGIEAAFSGYQERLIRCMSDASYEVRLASLKWLFWLLKRGESSGGDQLYCGAMRICSTNINLQDTLVKLLDSEKHHKCMRYLLKILYTWNSLDFQDNQPSLEPRYVYTMDSRSIFQLWNKLVSLFKITRHAKTRQILICCLGMCAKKMSTLCMSFISSGVAITKTAEHIPSHSSKIFLDFYDPLSYFVDLIEINSDASESVNMRKAAAESMIASGMLAHAQALGPLVFSYPISDGTISSHIKPQEAIRLYARKVLDLWFTCIKLLEDEDVGLRKGLALDVQKCFPSKKPEKNFPDAMATSQVEKVMELCFEHLSTAFGSWIDYLDYLCCCAFNAGKNSNYNASGGDLVRRVFDKEMDNYHEEKLLVCQICCYHLETVLISKSEGGESQMESGTRDLLHKWRSRFLEQLTAFSHDHMEKRKSGDWIGGVGNHKDAFLPMYANLLGLHALSKCILKEEPESGGCTLSEVCALGEAIDPFLRNPLISNLYLMVVKSHDDSSLNVKWGDDNSNWGEFDPYFLLR